MNRSRARLRIFLARGMLVLSMIIAAGCAAREPQVALRGQVFTVDLAVTREEQARGLMFVDSLDRDRGMLFIFPREAPRSFWMKNTRIPLDILYFDSELTLVSMAENARPCAADPCPSYPSGRPARYVLELNGGMARTLGAERGDRLTLLFEP